MVDNPSLSVIGMTGGKQNPRHYSQIENLYPNCRIHQYDVKTYVCVSSLLSVLDYMTLDSDFIYLNDDIHISKLITCTTRGHDYFSGMLKVQALDYPFFGRENIVNPKLLTQSVLKSRDTIQSMLYSDIILCSEYLKTLLDTIIPTVLSKTLADKIKDSMVVMPPPGLHKMKPSYQEKDFSTLNFVWNHRMSKQKDPEAFFRVLENLAKDFPDIPFTLEVAFVGGTDVLLKKVPKVLHSRLKISRFTTNQKEYSQLLDRMNITIDSSNYESFGISIIEAARSGSIVLSLGRNKAFSHYFGSDFTHSDKNMASKIASLYFDKEQRKQILTLLRKRCEDMKTLDTCTALLKEAMQKRFVKKLDSLTVTGKNTVVNRILKETENKSISKQELYDVLGWDLRSNKFYPRYYYQFRKVGIKTKFDGTRLHFYQSENTLRKVDMPIELPKTGIFY